MTTKPEEVSESGKWGADHEIGSGVGTFRVYGPLGACEHDRLPGMLYQIRESRSRIGQGICSVTDDEAIIAAVLFFNGLREDQPMLGADVGAVQIQKLHGVYLAEAAGLRQKGQKLLGRQFRGKSLFCFA